jgi:hypothetical protein
MSEFANDDYEANVEGTVADFLSRMPWNEPTACQDIRRFYNAQVDLYLENRRQRLLRDGRDGDGGT